MGKRRTGFVQIEVGYEALVKYLYIKSWAELVGAYQGKIISYDVNMYYRWKLSGRKQAFIDLVIDEIESFFLEDYYNTGLDGEYLIRKAKEAARKKDGNT